MGEHVQLFSREPPVFMLAGISGTGRMSLPARFLKGAAYGRSVDGLQSRRVGLRLSRRNVLLYL